MPQQVAESGAGMRGALAGLIMTSRTKALPVERDDASRVAAETAHAEAAETADLLNALDRAASVIIV
ncbi:hypothetical protein [Methylobacterium sp. ap11]|jgi:hypothetical protein|uniref:hypothetical protein n=1 Tax=Methylobacterium sp. ap11 TaxID=1761799 RepID=UPI00116051D6|nr:hypothetical protein [Methylobacterium sp. ap11]